MNQREASAQHPRGQDGAVGRTARTGARPPEGSPRAVRTADELRGASYLLSLCALALGAVGVAMLAGGDDHLQGLWLIGVCPWITGVAAVVTGSRARRRADYAIGDGAVAVGWFVVIVTATPAVLAVLATALTVGL